MGGLGTYVTCHISEFFFFLKILSTVLFVINVPLCVFVLMCIIDHYGNGMLDAGGDDGDDRLPGRYVVL